MGTTRQRKIAVIVISILSLLLFLGLAALNAFRLPFLNPDTPSEIFLFTSISLLAFLLFIAALLLLARNALKLYADQRSRVLGARLRTRMLWGAIMLSLLPISCMFAFSYLLMNRAVERWFSQPADQLRTESSRVALDLSRYVEANARSEAESIAGSITDSRGHLVHDDLLHERMQQHEVTLQGGFVLVYRAGKVVASFRLPPSDRARLSTWQLKSNASEDSTGADAGALFTVSDTGSLETIARAAAERTDQPILSVSRADYIAGSAWVKPDVLVVTALPLPAGMTANIAALDRAGEQYWTLFRLRRQIRATYMLLMLMITGLSLFAASWLALYLSKQVTRPVEALAEAMAAIAQGDYAQRVQPSATEELGDLVQSFNTMAEDLQSSRRIAERSTVQVFEANVQLEQRRRELETMLQTIPNGVVMLDANRVIRVANRAFSEMLDPGGQQSFVGLPLESVMDAEAMEVLDRIVRRSHRMGTASGEMDMRSPAGTLNIAATVALLEDGSGPDHTTLGYVLVLENATELLRAQKQSAWKEVARRVAHEIKNPLTPISLSAEQIHRHIRRLGDLLQQHNIESPSVATIQRSSEVISSSVGSMRSLVDQFSSLAEFPNARPRPAELNTILENTISLFAGRLNGILVVKNLAPSLPLVMADPEALKRAVSNLIDNAAEAMTHSLLREIQISTALSESSAGMVEVVVGDTGPGVTDDMRERLFLPYFSTKQRGTGLGLTITSKIIAEHQGTIRAEKNTPEGARFIIELPIAAPDAPSSKRNGSDTERDPSAAHPHTENHTEAHTA